MAYTERTVTIAANGTQSTDLDIAEYTMMTLMFDANWESTALTIQVKDTQGNYYDLMAEDGTPVSLTLAADNSNDAIGFDASLLEAVAAGKIRFVAGTTELAERTIRVALKR